jgi:hypothetical protein
MDAARDVQETNAPLNILNHVGALLITAQKTPTAVTLRKPKVAAWVEIARDSIQSFARTPWQEVNASTKSVGMFTRGRQTGPSRPQQKQQLGMVTRLVVDRKLLKSILLPLPTPSPLHSAPNHNNSSRTKINRKSLIKQIPLF